MVGRQRLEVGWAEDGVGGHRSPALSPSLASRSVMIFVLISLITDRPTTTVETDFFSVPTDLPGPKNLIFAVFTPFFRRIPGL